MKISSQVKSSQVKSSQVKSSQVKSSQVKSSLIWTVLLITSLIACSTDTAPNTAPNFPVSNLNTTSQINNDMASAITVSWEEPSDANFKEVRLTCTPACPNEPITINKGTTTTVINFEKGSLQGTMYEVKVTVISNDNQEAGTVTSTSPIYDYEYEVEATHATNTTYLALNSILVSSFLDLDEIANLPIANLAYTVGTSRSPGTVSYPAIQLLDPEDTSAEITSTHTPNLLNSNGNVVIIGTDRTNPVGNLRLRVDATELLDDSAPATISTTGMIKTYTIFNRSIYVAILSGNNIRYEIIGRADNIISYPLIITGASPDGVNLISSLDGGMNGNGNANFSITGHRIQPNGNPTSDEGQRLVAGNTHIVGVQVRSLYKIYTLVKVVAAPP